MRVLLTGASGFIGRRLLAALLSAEHEVVCALRNPPASSSARLSYVRIDFNQALRPEDWNDAVAGVDLVVNAVGIFRESARQSFDTIHRAAPSALFSAAARGGVKHIVQISALGADAGAQTPFHLSKKAADDLLMTLPVRATVIQPSLVYGPEGASAALFEMFASMPLIPLPGDGRQAVQPIHIDDLIAAVLALIESPESHSERIAMVGPTPISLREFYTALRRAMGLVRTPRFLPVPLAAMSWAARWGRWLPGGFLDSDALSMLERGNTASPDRISQSLGRAPRAAEDFVPGAYARAVRTLATLRWLTPILRLSIGLVWMMTGIVSLGLYPVADSYELLARVGSPEWAMPLLLYGAAILDIALGMLTLSPWRGRWLWTAQAALVIIYTLIISLKIPEFWLHPYGPVLKNFPFLVGLWILYELEERRWTTSS